MDYRNNGFANLDSCNAQCARSGVPMTAPAQQSFTRPGQQADDPEPSGRQHDRRTGRNLHIERDQQPKHRGGDRQRHREAYLTRQ